MGIFETIRSQPGRKSNGLPITVERRSESREPMLRTSTTGLTSHLWELELVPAFGLIRLCDDIDRLSRRALDQNVFFDSSVLRSAWPRLTSLLAPRGAWMLCLWESAGDGRHLRLFMPVRIHKVGFPAHKVLQPLSNEYMPLGTPLIDRDCAEESAETLLRLLSDPVLKLPSIVDFTHQREDSATYAALQNATRNLGLASHRNMAHQRAALLPDPESSTDPKPTLSKKRLRELARQLRKLEKSGPVNFHCARSKDKIVDAIEAFMILELSGWKGRKGTALYNHKKIAAFSRQIVYELAAKNHCEIFSLHQNEKPIASLIMLGRDGYLVPWKMAFDENLSAYSPGMQVMVNATNILKERGNFVEADSLAVANHTMMNRVWPDRVPIADLTIALNPDGGEILKNVVKAKERLLKMRNFARTALRKKLHA
ncbi:MAG: GNAT family N-acetyltransferase [Rhizobiaceae bacterium]|nr:GNAT family N-acetyltransferase [Rhizobiaceae bacterium]